MCGVHVSGFFNIALQMIIVLIFIACGSYLVACAITIVKAHNNRVGCISAPNREVIEEGWWGVLVSVTGLWVAFALVLLHSKLFIL